MSKKSNLQDLHQLRKAAEAELACHAPPMAATSRPVEELLHELQVHQIELEMQNEALRQSQLELEESRDRYADLYDFAPIGYLTLTPEAIISEINLTGAELLGVERKKLLGRRFERSIAPEDSERWHRHFLGVLKKNGTHSCELALQRGDGSRFHAGLDCVCIQAESKPEAVRVVLTDITERKRTETMLRESEEKFRGILEGTLDGIALADTETKRFTHANSAFCRMLGYSPEELTRLGVADIHPLQDLPHVIEQFESQLHGKTQLAADIPVKRKDGSVFYADINSAPVILGGKTYLAGTFRDITERKQAEEALRNSENKFSILFSKASLPAVLSRFPDHVFVDVNDAYAQLFGYTKEELIGKTSFELGINRDAEHRTRTIAEVRQRNSVHNLEQTLFSKSGDALTVLTNIGVIVIGGQDYTLTSVQDITGRKRAEQALKNLSDRLQHILASTPAVHYACRIDGGHFVPTYASPNLKGIWGYGPEEYLGNAEWWWSGIHPEGRDSVVGAFRAAIMAADRSHYVHEYRFRRKDGAYRWVHDELQIIRDQAGQPLEIVGSWLDITERKQTETELKEHQQLLRELAAQDVKLREAEHKHIAREVHDELGQLLTALRMDISLLRIQFGKRDPVLMKKIKEMLALVDKTIQGVRDVTVNLRPAALDMGIVPAIGWLCDNFSGRADTAYTFRVIDNPVELDEERTVAMFRIVQESLTNVMRYAEANSVEITIGQRGDDVAVEVRDDGKGFDSAAMPANKSFGLLGMRERAMAVGGKVEITSAPSKGTVVSVRIPIKPKGNIA